VIFVASEVERLRQLAQRAGWRISPGSKHEQWRSPDGVTIVHVPPPGAAKARRKAGRHLENLRATLKRGGLHGC